MEKYRPWLVFLAIFVFVGVGVVVASYFLRGYRLDWRRGLLEPSGLLVVNSNPKGASVFINDKLVTATDDTLNLPPNRYRLKIVKDGYLPWEKTVNVKKEIVKQINAYLFCSTPDLKPLTFTGAINPQLAPNGGRVVYAVASASAQSKNGIWVNNLSQRSPLDIVRSNSQQLTRRDNQHLWEKAHFVWSPDSQQVLAYFSRAGTVAAAYLLPASRLISNDQLHDVSFRLPFILKKWRFEKNQEQRQQWALFPEGWQKVASKAATLITFSPDSESVLYLATRKVTLPANLNPHPPARSDQPETRQIKPGYIYVYNRKEDTNFQIGSADDLGVDRQRLQPAKTLLETLARFNYQPVRWLTAHHLVFINHHQVMVVESDGQNKQALFNGPFIDSFAYPWPDGEKLLVLTSLFPHRPPNLYIVGIK